MSDNLDTTTAPAQQTSAMADGRILVTFPLKFRRKKDKSLVDGKEVETITQREGFTVSLAKHTQDTILEAMASENNQVKDFIVGLVNDQLMAALRAQADENQEAKSFGDLDSNLLTLEQLAKDSAAGSGGKPSTESFDAFCADYIKSMPAVAGIATSAAQTAAAEFKNGKFGKTQYNEKALKTLENRLGQYVSGAPNADQFEEVTSWLAKKLTKLVDGLVAGEMY